MSNLTAVLDAMGFKPGTVFYLDHPNLTSDDLIRARDAEIVIGPAAGASGTTVKLHIDLLFSVKEITNDGAIHSHPESVGSHRSSVVDGMQIHGKLTGVSAEPDGGPTPLPKPVQFYGFARFHGYNAGGPARQATGFWLQILRPVQLPISELHAYCARM